MQVDTGSAVGAPRARSYAGLGTVYAGLSDEEVEVRVHTILQSYSYVTLFHGSSEQGGLGPVFPKGRHRVSMTGSGTVSKTGALPGLVARLGRQVLLSWRLQGG